MASVSLFLFFIVNEYFFFQKGLSMADCLTVCALISDKGVLKFRVLFFEVNLKFCSII